MPEAEAVFSGRWPRARQDVQAGLHEAEADAVSELQPAVHAVRRGTRAALAGLALGRLAADLADVGIRKGTDHPGVHDCAFRSSLSAGGSLIGYEKMSISTGTAPAGRSDGSVSRSWNRGPARSRTSALSCLSSSAVM